MRADHPRHARREFPPRRGVPGNLLRDPGSPVAPLETPAGRREAYRASLKPAELEEPLDRIVYRPLAFLVAWPLRRSRVAPDHVSVASMLCGIAAGCLFWRATPAAALAAGLACFAGNVLDCADGQLARLKGSASSIGYLVDGAADYIGTIAVFVGMAHSLNVRWPAAVNWWWLAVAAGASMAWQCAFLDEKRGAWVSRVYRRNRDRNEELEAMARRAEAWRLEGSHPGGRLLTAAYRWYRRAWKPLTRPDAEPVTRAADEPSRWAECHRPVLARSVWIGSTMHITAIVFCAGLLDRPELYLWGAVGAGNLWMLATLAAERRAVRCAETPP